MRFRRLRLLAVSFVLLYAVTIFLFRPTTFSGEDLLPSSVREAAADWDFSRLFSKVKTKESYSFDLWADRILARYVSTVVGNAAKILQFDLEPTVPESLDTIEIPEFVGSESENPHLLPFDSRLALGVLLHDVADTLELDLNMQNYQLELFHWADWADLSILHPHMFSAGSDRLTCSAFSRPKDKSSRFALDSLPVEDYCVDDSELAKLAHSVEDKTFKAQLEYVQKSTNRLGFHIINHAGRVEHLLRPLFSAAYVNDFMPAPVAVVLLLPSESRNSTLMKVPVDRDLLARTRLVDSKLAQRVAQKSKTLDLRQDVGRILAKLPPSAKSNFQIASPLTHDMFLERLKDHLEQLKENLSPFEQNYKEALELSLATEWPSKYFNEAKIANVKFPQWAKGDHYDARFFKGLVPSDVMQPHLFALLQAWLQFVESAGIKSWIAHGSLLSWYWNGGFFPWDVDIDIQMPIEEFHRLARGYNNTVIVNLGNDPNKEVRTGRYFLDCATWISHRTSGSGHNNIDARFIDLDSGLYVDITALAVSNTIAPARYDDEVPAALRREFITTVSENGRKKEMRIPDDREMERNKETHLYNCRNNHYLSLNELSPLRLTYVQGVPAYVPNNIADILRTEYGARSIMNQQFAKHTFLPRLGVWEKRTEVRKYMSHKIQGSKLDLGDDEKSATDNMDSLSILKLSDRDYLEWMSMQPELLVRYHMGRKIARTHQAEMELLMAEKNTSPVIVQNGELLCKFDDIYHDVNKYKVLVSESDYNTRVQDLLTQWKDFRSGKFEPVKKVETGDGEAENAGKAADEESSKANEASDKASDNVGDADELKDKKDGILRESEYLGEPIVSHSEPPKLKAFQAKMPEDKNGDERL